MKLKRFIESLYFLKIYLSPFRGIKPKFYFGEIKIANPYFMPRRYNKKEKKYESITNFGIDYNTLGWKTKFNYIRFEYNPSYSLVIFNKQFNITFVPNYKNGYADPMWEAWLYYYYRTDKSLSTKERLYQLFEQYNCTYSWSSNGETNKVDNYLYILKEKHLNLYKEWLRDKDPSYRREKKLEKLGL